MSSAQHQSQKYVPPPDVDARLKGRRTGIRTLKSGIWRVLTLAGGLLWWAAVYGLGCVASFGTGVKAKVTCRAIDMKWIVRWIPLIKWSMAGITFLVSAGWWYWPRDCRSQVHKAYQNIASETDALRSTCQRLRSDGMLLIGQGSAADRAEQARWCESHGTAFLQNLIDEQEDVRFQAESCTTAHDAAVRSVDRLRRYYQWRHFWCWESGPRQRFSQLGSQCSEQRSRLVSRKATFDSATNELMHAIEDGEFVLYDHELSSQRRHSISQLERVELTEDCQGVLRVAGALETFVQFLEQHPDS